MSNAIEYIVSDTVCEVNSSLNSNEASANMLHLVRICNWPRVMVPVQFLFVSQEGEGVFCMLASSIVVATGSSKSLLGLPMQSTERATDHWG